MASFRSTLSFVALSTLTLFAACARSEFTPDDPEPSGGAAGAAGASGKGGAAGKGGTGGTSAGAAGTTAGGSGGKSGASGTGGKGGTGGSGGKGGTGGTAGKGGTGGTGGKGGTGGSGGTIGKGGTGGTIGKGGTGGTGGKGGASGKGGNAGDGGTSAGEGGEAGAAGDGGAAGESGAAGDAGAAGEGGAGGESGAAGSGGEGGAAGSAGAAGQSGAAGAGGSGPVAGCKLVINEVCTEGCSTPSGGANASDEFVELFNAGTETCPLKGWKVINSSDQGGFGSALWTGVDADTLAPGAFFLIGGPQYKGAVTANFSYKNGAIAVGGGGVGLIAPGDDDNEDSDGVVWKSGKKSNAYTEGDPIENIPEHRSASRFPDGADTNQNTVDFKMPTTPTPGAANKAN